MAEELQVKADIAGGGVRLVNLDSDHIRSGEKNGAIKPELVERAFVGSADGGRSPGPRRHV
jgi:hypothetical protein